MTYKIINTGDYLLIVDDKTLTDMPNNINVYSVRYNKPIRFAETENSYMNECFEIKAHLPLNNSPILEGVNLLPPLPMRLQAVGQTKIPVEFECEIGVCETWLMEECYSRFQCCGQPEKIKTTTNSGGLTQWVGEYIY